MRAVLGVVLIGALGGCAEASQEVEFNCLNRKNCPDTSITATETSGEVSGDAPPVTDDAVKTDSSVPPMEDSSTTTGGDVIFPVEDTKPPCEAGATFCSDEEGCKDLNSDLANCGMCGKACAPLAGATESCTAGKCTFTCIGSRADCDMSAANGCEVNTATDENNCGMCGRKCLIGATCVSGTCTSPTVVVETFEPSWPKPGVWSVGGGAGSAGSASAACAHDGALGYLPPASNPANYYRTDVSVGAPGTKVSAWVKTNATGLTTSGRIWLGFGATSLGAWSIVIAPNTNELFFERNSPYGSFTVVGTKKIRTWATGVWHKIEVTFAAGGVTTARVYAADGTTLLDTITETLTGFTPGGLFLRAFHGASCVDTIAR